MSPESGIGVFARISYEIRDQTSLNDGFEAENISLNVGARAWQNNIHLKGRKGTAVSFTASGSRCLELEILPLPDFHPLCVENDSSYSKELREQ